jgi:hypothetical protein
MMANLDLNGSLTPQLAPVDEDCRHRYLGV